MIRIVEGSLLNKGRLGILPGAFHPPTTAHVALVEGARKLFALDQIVFVLPRTLPHKSLDHRQFEQRLDWITALAGSKHQWLAASAEDGLVVDIVHEFREQVGEAVELFVVSGRDAAERFVSWDYGDAPPFDKQLRHFQLLVGSREGSYSVPPAHIGRIHPFGIAPRFDAVSATSVREQSDWDAVPPVIRSRVKSALTSGER